MTTTQLPAVFWSYFLSYVGAEMTTLYGFSWVKRKRSVRDQRVITNGYFCVCVKKRYPMLQSGVDLAKMSTNTFVV